MFAEQKAAFPVFYLGFYKQDWQFWTKVAEGNCLTQLWYSLWVVYEKGISYLATHFMLRIKATYYL